ncbi:6-phosphogluconolactonase [Streptomyces sp. NBC_01340]|uniref:6-phosphogluconolactonase n=1 Tax=unclassified Streptomyces TaxID=2593676 RepID=UPI00225453B8|nr:MULTISPECIES: 6-phosphogluconolactonase [unclassified Streptomyces]MCX4452092.1 6-phosphogluconolactonase [Streptomyces sp. NBC_01719]MCX4491452.1 6-phosphogluconolactonase [Streptomyces sp. NBC_01728]MCX4593972.1 6-phosphogluconolactonase [Streptomyces sp. NBC_01549]WSI36760.1 6-phosphogluconolactonase [Streptomyces sp. NBC_01340]
MHHELEVVADPDAVAGTAAAFVARLARACVQAHGRFTFAVSGGHTPWAMFARLAHEDVPWERVAVLQVDERVAPDGDPDRNLTHLRESLGAAPAEVIAMPVNDADLDAAAAAYGRSLPERFDLVHLGLGPDGHTASLVPRDPVLEVSDRPVALTAPYMGHRRMTLTYPALARAQQVLWLITGADKREPLSRLVAGDRSIPAGRVEAAASLVLADAAAAGRGLLASAPSRQQDHDARPPCRAGSVRRMRWLRTRRTFPLTCWSFSGSVETSRVR